MMIFKAESCSKAAVYGLIGNPVQQSLSPAIFHFVFNDLNIEAEYRLWEIKENEFPDAVKQFRQSGVKGFNVTTPYKSSVIGLLDGIDEQASKIGAINCVVSRNNKMIGYNTDYLGVSYTLTPFREVLQNTPILILGAGGAARAAVYALLTEYKTEQIFVVNRSHEHTEKIINDFQFLDRDKRLDILPVGKRIPDETIFLINCIPPNAFKEFLSENFRRLNAVQWIFDMSYLTAEDEVKYFFRQKIMYINGLPMLVHQAAESFKIWFGQKMPGKKVMEYIRSKQFRENAKL